MRILGIETSGDVAGVAVADEHGLVAELTFRHRLELSRFLIPRIEQVLQVAGTSLAEIDGVAVSLGPGSFTGLRIGVTAAKSLAYARDLPVVGVSTLESLAAERPAPEAALVCAVVPASPTHLFAALYQWKNGALEPRAEELLLPIRELADRLAAAPLDVVLAGQAGVHRELLAERLGPRLTLSGDQVARAGTVAQLGRRRLAAGEQDALHALAPRYLRLSTPEERRKEAPCPAS